ncbi:MAG: ABC transporter ATP-binding protein [Deltaproteobacteria bacterium]|jgi:peptide/nickel transport system ATP-binding protein
MNLLVAKGVSVVFRRRGHVLNAVDGVDLSLEPGETVGLVGESGSGKSTLARALLGLVSLEAGTVDFDGTRISALDERAMRPHRRRLQMVFQDPYGALNPRRTVGAALTEALAFHGVVDKAQLRPRAAELLDRVGLPASTFDRFPHELSGGQRQRIGIARAVSVEPKLIVADEPVSALDVSVRAQILALLSDLKAQLGLTYLFISHDLSVVEYFCDHILVMNAGKIVERLPARDARAAATHPYTKKLFDAIPRMRP